MRVRATIIALTFLAVGSTTVRAQAGAGNPVEIGADAQISFGLDDQGNGIDLPLPKIRAGFPIATAMTFEPALGFSRRSNDNVSVSRVLLDLSLLYHFSPDRAANQFYVRPVIGFVRHAVSNDAANFDESETFTSLGVAGGIKIPMGSGIATRLEAEFRNQLEHDGNPSQAALNLNFGLSFHTR